MEDARFLKMRREHEAILQALGRLEAAVGPSGSSEAEGGGVALLAALTEFLDFHETTLEPHMKAEELEVYPLLDRYLPPEVGSAATMLREHETARGLVALLRRARGRLSQGAPDADSDVASLAEDLALLLRDHIRKEDGVIGPLLQRLLREDVRA